MYIHIRIYLLRPLFGQVNSDNLSVFPRARAVYLSPEKRLEIFRRACNFERTAQVSTSAEHQREDDLYCASLATAQSASSENAYRFSRCVDTDALDAVFERACCGAQRTGSI